MSQFGVFVHKYLDSEVASDGFEIERKFFLNREVFADMLLSCKLRITSECDILQGYLCTGKEDKNYPEEDEPFEVRIRRERRDTGSSYSIVKKSSGSLVRSEEQEEISQGVFDILSRLVPNSLFIHKKRITVVDDMGTKFYIDYFGNLSTIVEVEFESVREADAFKKPRWLGEEVTNDPYYKNVNRWMRARDGVVGVESSEGGGS